MEILQFYVPISLTHVDLVCHSLPIFSVTRWDFWKATGIANLETWPPESPLPGQSTAVGVSQSGTGVDAYDYLVIFQREFGYVMLCHWEWLYVTETVFALPICLCPCTIVVRMIVDVLPYVPKLCMEVFQGVQKTAKLRLLPPGKNLGPRGQGVKGPRGQGAKGPRGQGAKVRRLSLTIFCLLMDLLPICGLSAESF